jgi:hypothetical protein
MNVAATLIAGTFRIDPQVPTEILILLLLLGALIFMWDLFDRQTKKIKSETGLSDKSEMVALRGSSYLQAKEYRSEKLGPSGRKCAIVTWSRCWSICGSSKRPRASVLPMACS